MLTQNTSNYIQQMYCELCDFRCSKKGDWNRHILTSKHMNAYTILTQNKQINKYECECGYSYTHRQSLYTHKKKCSFTKVNNDGSQPLVANTDTNIIVELMKQNQEFKNLLVEQNKTIIEAMKHHSISNSVCGPTVI